MRTLYPQERFAVPTPLGVTLVVQAAGGAINAAGFARIRSARRERPKTALLREAVKQIDAYFAKRLRRFDLPLSFEGTAFQLDVWRFVARLEFGEIVSYSDVARIVGRPGAHRGVARAMSESPMELFVPAHRVVGADGTVRGAGPQSMRRRLLAFEGIRLR
ncbi:MAG TPA: methylated-DNA--[protein]-cysteine S-methyltransferase [Candidatus Baltobacteraceae bacterium]|jgi:methylated-DNA-[protein]-cysteine S-methyltransferase|nr:methylated-DNA--[protein]-cysteine S-methyltransferase [Candidatus Baltobacteraceae bacterium]